MIIYRLFALAWLFTLPILAQLLVKLFRLERFKINLADLSLPFYAFAIFQVSKRFFTHSFLPHYLAVMAILALVICTAMLNKQETFLVKRFFKLFWRIGFFVTAFCYLLTIILIFFK